jgi:hypothetical protein
MVLWSEIRCGSLAPSWGYLSAKEVLREPRGDPENLGRRRVPEVRDTEPN